MLQKNKNTTTKLKITELSLGYL